MSKDWKCADCVKYKTDACSTCACGYTPTVSCRDVLVDFDYAYQQGREDGYAQAENDYFAQSQKDREDTYNCGYAIGRADVIDDVLSICHHSFTVNEVIEALKQLKEQSGNRCKGCARFGDLHSSCEKVRLLQVDEDTKACENFKGGKK